MRLKLAILFATCLSSLPAAASWFPSVFGGENKNALGAYNFNYVVRGAKDISPLQVFDDGKRTYLQFNEAKGVDIPAIFMPNGSAMVPARYTIEGPYVVVDHVAQRLELAGGGNRRVTITAEGKARQAAATLPAPVVAAKVPEATPPAPKVVEAPKPVSQQPTQPVQPVGIAASKAGSEYVPMRSTDIPRARKAQQALATEVPVSTGGVQIRREPPPPAPVPVPPPAEDETVAQLRALQAQMNVLMQRLQERPAKAGQPPAGVLPSSTVRPDIESAPQQDQRWVRNPAAPAAPGTKPGYLYAMYDAQGSFKGLADRNPQDQPAFASAAVAVPVPVPSKPPAPATAPAKEMELRIENEQRLSEALRTFLGEQGWDLEWTHTSDFVVRRGYVIRGQVLEDMMQTVLRDYRLSATFYNANRVVAVGATP